MSDELQLLYNWIDGHRDDLVQALCGVLRIPSVQQPAAGPDAPYGLPVREALDYTLDVCRDLGFRVEDFGGHAAHAEFGEGKEMVAAIGHLDVVPEGAGWTYPPYGAEIHDGYIYARGAEDDKGPTYAALFAAKALMDCALPLDRRVRIIFGCNEESGFGCVRHYWEVAQQEKPAYAFTPDACFPLVYAEKGIANATISNGVSRVEGDLRLQSASGGLRANMVPEHAEALLEGTPDALLAALQKLQEYWDRNVTATLEGKSLRVSARGKSAHGSSPHEGDNAIVRLARVLRNLDLPGERGWLDWVVRTGDAGGTGLGIEGRDEVAGRLTCNLGTLERRDFMVRIVYNIRYPVTWTSDTVSERIRKGLEKTGWRLDDLSDSRPLYVPLDREPARTLLHVYRLETGDGQSEPRTMGGGTYARAIPNALAYGASFPDSADGPAHEPNERIAIDTLVRAAKIYAHALYALANLP